MEWKTVKLGDIGKVVTGKTPRTSIAENYGGNIPFLTPSDDMAQKFAPVTNKTLTEQGLREVKNCLIPANSVCVSCIGSDLGKVVMNREPLVTNQQINSIIPHEDVDAHFVYYAMIEIGKHLNHLSKTSTAVPIINKSTFSNTELAIPSLETQRRIAAILSSLDDKIENNNRINRNLEAQAQALFKSWFVDFEPWGGTMPEDWKEGTLGEIAEFKRGKGILGKDARPGNVPVVAGGMEPAYYHDTANTKAPVITISASGANAGYVRLYNEGIWASDCSWIDASSKNLLWVYCYLSINRHILRHAQTGAVQPHVKAKDVNAFEIIVPVQKVIEDFIEVVKPLFDQVAINQRENQRLASLRDTLLPKLMKGEIEV